MNNSNGQKGAFGKLLIGIVYIWFNVVVAMALSNYFVSIGKSQPHLMAVVYTAIGVPVSLFAAYFVGALLTRLIDFAN